MEGQEGNHGAISARLDYTAPAPPGARLWDGQDVAHGALLGPSQEPRGEKKWDSTGSTPIPRSVGLGCPRGCWRHHPAGSPQPAAAPPCPCCASILPARPWARTKACGGEEEDEEEEAPTRPGGLQPPPRRVSPRFLRPGVGTRGSASPSSSSSPPLAQQLSAPCHRDAGTEVENLGASRAASHRLELGDVSGSLPSLPAPRGEEGKAPATSPIARAPSRPLPLFRFSPCHVGSSGNRQEVKTQHEARGCARLPLNPSAPSSPSPGTDLV